jgi:hypothetical protein
VVATQSSDEVVIGSVQMEVSGELVGRGLPTEASEALTLGVRKMTGRLSCETSKFCEGDGRYRKTRRICSQIICAKSNCFAVSFARSSRSPHEARLRACLNR